MFNVGFILFVSFLVLYVWHYFCPWHCYGHWLGAMNIAMVMFALLFIAMTYICVYFIYDCVYGYESQWGILDWWMKPLVLFAPVPCVFTYMACAYQAYTHVSEIKAEVSPAWHDNVVQIIVLPAVYAIMSLSAMVRCFKLVGDENLELSNGLRSSSSSSSIDYGAKEQYAMAETDMTIADLYESWALYQFGQLVLALISRDVEKQQRSDYADVRIAAESLAIANQAVSNLAWLGLWLFLVVCVCESAYDTYLIVIYSATEEWYYTYSVGHDYFTAAGWVSSAAAIWNVAVVEHTFADNLASFSPWTKFLSVKILLTLAFVQWGLIEVLQYGYDLFPSVLQKIANAIPVVGDILEFSPEESYLFYTSLVVWECFIVATMHFFAWSCSENWYRLDVEVCDDEQIGPPSISRSDQVSISRESSSSSVYGSAA